ncbi:hypothetical protein ABVY47_004543 [Vibrio parahaemolyticus]|uniref:hypothetical protein n=1 Tax=Vibrio harveyi group TaxID=717610 RepID=UPI0009408262|nr:MULTISPECIES: hypothetical protein [Vibrio harveyi group]EHG1305008.1 hypothetical protein [Vibrio parahaemolyticus]EHH2421781.1 hypothetical protein [Vibrio parahaemolyticus]EJC6794227.1 hypothetical protein [Vibrio parahaemolyticus]EJC6850820.1 hypothetical protein [Vibrio parahaemolyticus]EJC7138209.1 hypothetical protein [Vibrio parahaemolyticus]
MDFKVILEIVGAIGLSLGGGAVLVFALSKWLGDLWAKRILENERANLTREYELLVRRRDVYTNLMVAMRVFVNSGTPASPQEKADFLKAYDLAALWASEDVVIQMSQFMDSLIKGTPSKDEFLACITEMRKDCGFPNTKYEHKVVYF